MQKVLRVMGIVGKALNVISIAALLVMICVTVADIFLKQLFKAPITGAVEITRMMMICMMPSFISALVENRHVSVGLFIDKLSRTGQLVFDCFAYLLSAGICGLMCYQGFVDMSKKLAQNQVYTMLKIPTWPFYLIFAVAMGFLSLAILVYLVNRFVDKNSHIPHHEIPENTDGGTEA